MQTARRPRATPAARRAPKAFTLVEILIVVIILGILAAIVIPQFTNASEDARKSSLVSQTQTIRSQLELYYLQHHDEYPSQIATGTTDEEQWEQMVQKSDEDGAVPPATGATPLGPYLQATPQNSLNGFSKVQVIAAESLAADPANDAGFVFFTDTGRFFATNKDCTGLYGVETP